MRGYAPFLATAAALIAAVLLVTGLPAEWPLGLPGSDFRVGGAVGAVGNVELLELNDTASGAAFTVTGQVHNPEHAPPRERLSAVVQLFDNRGVTIGSGEREVAAHLAPGQTANFIVTLDATTPAAHFRVSFREGRTVVPHVDLRSLAPEGATSRLGAGGAGKAGGAGRERRAGRAGQAGWGLA